MTATSIITTISSTTIRITISISMATATFCKHSTPES